MPKFEHFDHEKGTYATLDESSAKDLELSSVLHPRAPHRGEATEYRPRRKHGQRVSQERIDRARMMLNRQTPPPSNTAPKAPSHETGRPFDSKGKKMVAALPGAESLWERIIKAICAPFHKKTGGPKKGKPRRDRKRPDNKKQQNDKRPHQKQGTDYKGGAPAGGQDQPRRRNRRRRGGKGGENQGGQQQGNHKQQGNNTPPSHHNKEGATPDQENPKRNRRPRNRRRPQHAPQGKHHERKHEHGPKAGQHHNRQD